MWIMIRFVDRINLVPSVFPNFICSFGRTFWLTSLNCNQTYDIFGQVLSNDRLICLTDYYIYLYVRDGHQMAGCCYRNLHVYCIDILTARQMIKVRFFGGVIQWNPFNHWGSDIYEKVSFIQWFLNAILG